MDVVHNEPKHRFEVAIGGEFAMLQYRRNGNKITMYHTEVPPAAGGKGVGGELAAAALEFARTEKLAVVPACSFVAKYIERHPGYADLLEDRS